MVAPHSPTQQDPNQYWHHPDTLFWQGTFNIGILFDLSTSKGVRNGLTIGVWCGGLLRGLEIVGSSTAMRPSVLGIIWELLVAILFSGVMGGIFGFLHGIGWSVGNTTLAPRVFHLLRGWVPFGLCAGVVNVLLVLVLFWLLCIGANPHGNPFAINLEIFIRFPYDLTGLGKFVLINCIYCWFHSVRLGHWYAQRLWDRQNIGLIGNITDIYARPFQQGLFSALAKHYNRTSNLVSLGLSNHWRASLVRRMDLAPGMAVCDLMSGGGELWPQVLRRIGPSGQITAVDNTPAMLAHAQQRQARLPASSAVTLHEADGLATGLPDESFDAIVCAYGVKTLSHHEIDSLVQEMHRILRSGGIFGMVELSQPPDGLLRRALDFYLAQLLPLLSLLLGADQRPYLMLGEYVTRFGNLDWLIPSLRMYGFTFYHYQFLGGCATAIVGMKG